MALFKWATKLLEAAHMCRRQNERIIWQLCNTVSSLSIILFFYTTFRWVGDEDWTFTGQFQLSSSQLDAAKIELDCEGLDTVAEVLINGIHIGDASNMFVRWECVNELVKIKDEATQVHLGREVSLVIIHQRPSNHWTHLGCGCGEDTQITMYHHYIRKGGWKKPHPKDAGGCDALRANKRISRRSIKASFLSEILSSGLHSAGNGVLLFPHRISGFP